MYMHINKEICIYVDIKIDKLIFISLFLQSSAAGRRAERWGEPSCLEVDQSFNAFERLQSKRVLTVLVHVSGENQSCRCCYPDS